MAEETKKCCQELPPTPTPGSRPTEVTDPHLTEIGDARSQSKIAKV